MALDLSDLMQNVYNFFLSRYCQTRGGAQSNTFLSFEGIGLPVSPESYKLRPEDKGYFPKLAVQRVAELVNVLPGISADVFHHTSYSVDGIYSLLLDAIPASADDNRLAFFAEQRSEAEQLFESHKSPSFIAGDTGEFRLVRATPENWYDPGAASNWATQTFTAGNQQSAAAAPAPGTSTVHLNPQLRAWDFRVLPKQLLPLQSNPKLTAQIATHKLTVKPTGLAAAEIKPQEATQIKPAALAGRSFSFPTQVNALPATKRLPIEQRIAAAEKRSAPLMVKVNGSILQRRNMSELVKHTSGQPVTSDRFTLSFQYCIVQVDRPWLSPAYLISRGWYIPRYKAGELSTGTVNDNNGIFAALPVGFIVVKDLKISANWTEADFEAATESMAFGPFSTLGQTVDMVGSSLVVNGMQIIGWICQVMPMLPPAADPQL
jgi:hypothetical protein